MTQSISKGAVTMGLRMTRVGLDLVLVCMACKVRKLSLSLSLSLLECEKKVCKKDEENDAKVRVSQLFSDMDGSPELVG